MYSSKTNKMQRYTMVFITIKALHVSGCSSVHHQELKTVYTASGICRAFSSSYCYCEFFVELFLLLTAIVSELELTIAVGSRKSLTNIRYCVYSFELLMMGRGTA
jgi:hypothetical protein